MRKRESVPFRKRKRYLRGSTSRYGQVRPFTTIMLPKNSGFQMRETSLAGMKGPRNPSKKVRLGA
jgi:hypothetical protein